MKAVVVDDEPLIRQNISDLLAWWFPQITIAGTAAGVEEAVKLIEQHRPELLFLDIEIRGGTGFHVLQRVQYHGFRLIFVTAYNNHALQAIKMGAVDYLLKPINETEFREGVARAIASVKPPEETMLNRMAAQMPLPGTGRMVLRTLTEVHIIEIDNILRCEADNTYTTFYLASGEKIVVSKGLTEYDELLKPHGFFRVHQSHLVNVKAIRKIEKSDGGNLTLTDGTTVPVSTRRKPLLMDLIAGK